MNKLAKNLQKIRKEKHLSQEQLAERLNVSRQAISKWESGAAYPEMEKIVQICQEFDVDINVLLKSDVGEDFNERAARTKTNKYIDSFLEYISRVVRFSGAITWRTRVKCIFEQIGLVLLLYLLGTAGSWILAAVLGGILGAVLPVGITQVILRVAQAIYLAFAVIVAVICMLRVFRLRYLEVYEKAEKVAGGAEKETPGEAVEVDAERGAKDVTNGSAKEAAKGSVTESGRETVKGTSRGSAVQPKVIIRDAGHGPYAFVRAIGRMLLICVKIFAAITALLLGGLVIMTAIAVVMSFGAIGSGLFFVGALTAGVMLMAGLVMLLLALVNFVLGRRNNKKILALTLVGSIVGLGLGCGVATIGVANLEYGNINVGIEWQEIEMKPNLVVLPNTENLSFVETDNQQVLIEYPVNEACSTEWLDSVGPKYEFVYMLKHCSDPVKVIKFTFDQLNHKKLPIFGDELGEVKVYANRETLARIKQNREDFWKER